MTAALFAATEPTTTMVDGGLVELIPHEGWLTTHDQFERSQRGSTYRMDRFYRLVRQETGIGPRAAISPASMSRSGVRSATAGSGSGGPTFATRLRRGRCATTAQRRPPQCEQDQADPERDHRQ